MGRACWEDVACQVPFSSLWTRAEWEQKTHHTEDGIDHEVDGHVSDRSPVPHRPAALLVVGQEVVGQAAQGGLGRLRHPAPALGTCLAEGEREGVREAARTGAAAAITLGCAMDCGLLPAASPHLPVGVSHSR